MTNVSKNKLSGQELDKLFAQFEKVISSLDNKTSSPFLNELLGQEEKIMLAKRLCAVVMYIEDNSSYQVWQLLHISPTTANKIRLDYEIGKYKIIENVLKSNKTKYLELWNVLEVILQAKMPPRGKGRWKSAIKSLKR